MKAIYSTPTMKVMDGSELFTLETSGESKVWGVNWSDYDNNLDIFFGTSE